MADEHATLVEGASRGDGHAIDRLLERHLPGLLAYVRLHAGELRQKESCADLVQSVCLEALRQVDRFDYRGEGAFRRWLYALALSKVRDRHRYWHADKRRAPRAPDGEGDGDDGAHLDATALLPSFTTPSQVAIRGEDMRRLETVFAQLPEDYRQIVTLARIVGMSHAEIAVEMDRSEGAVRVLLHRALVRLGWLLHQERLREQGT